MKSNFFDTLSSFIGFTSKDIKNYINRYHTKYKIYTIPKKNGENRLIYHPCRNLKSIQYAAEISLLSKFTESDIARAYIRGMTSPLKKMALEHSSFDYTIRIDFKNFFPSITPDDFLSILSTQTDFSLEDEEFIKKLFFYPLSGSFILPIGAPTSPKISNLVMLQHDQCFQKIASTLDSSSCVSRYADDLYFSTNIKGYSKKFLDLVTEKCIELISPNLSINNEKTLFLSRRNKRQICGITITSDKKVSLGQSRKKHIKQLLYKFNKGELKNYQVATLIGLLAFSRDIEPHFYNKMIIKYGSSILREKTTPTQNLKSPLSGDFLNYETPYYVLRKQNTR